MSDLSFSGKDRKRPIGASQLTQTIYILLSQNPQGITRDEIYNKLKDNWGDTDTYRMYQGKLDRDRKACRASRSPGTLIQIDRGRYSADYNSPLFRERAQKWAISETLRKMKDVKTASKSEEHWFIGERVPRKLVNGKLAPIDVEKTVIQATNFMQEQIHRERIKSFLLEEIQKAKDPKRKIGLQDVYDYISGRIQ